MNIKKLNKKKNDQILFTFQFINLKKACWLKGSKPGPSLLAGTRGSNQGPE